MDTMNIALPTGLKQFVQDRVESGGYGSVSEYVRELIRADQKESAKGVLEAEVLKGINSGAASRMTRKDWEGIRAELQRRMQKRKKA